MVPKMKEWEPIDVDDQKLKNQAYDAPSGVIEVTLMPCSHAIPASCALSTPADLLIVSSTFQSLGNLVGGSATATPEDIEQWRGGVIASETIETTSFVSEVDIVKEISDTAKDTQRASFRVLIVTSTAEPKFLRTTFGIIQNLVRVGCSVFSPHSWNPHAISAFSVILSKSFFSELLPALPALPSILGENPLDLKDDDSAKIGQTKQKPTDPAKIFFNEDLDFNKIEPTATESKIATSTTIISKNILPFPSRFVSTSNVVVSDDKVNFQTDNKSSLEDAHIKPPQSDYRLLTGLAYERRVRGRPAVFEKCRDWTIVKSDYPITSGTFNVEVSLQSTANNMSGASKQNIAPVSIFLSDSKTNKSVSFVAAAPFTYNPLMATNMQSPACCVLRTSPLQFGETLKVTFDYDNKIAFCYRDHLLVDSISLDLFSAAPVHIGLGSSYSVNLIATLSSPTPQKASNVLSRPICSNGLPGSPAWKKLVFEISASLPKATPRDALNYHHMLDSMILAGALLQPVARPEIFRLSLADNALIHYLEQSVNVALLSLTQNMMAFNTKSAHITLNRVAAQNPRIAHIVSEIYRPLSERDSKGVVKSDFHLEGLLAEEKKCFVLKDFRVFASLIESLRCIGSPDSVSARAIISDALTKCEFPGASETEGVEGFKESDHATHVHIERYLVALRKDLS